MIIQLHTPKGIVEIDTATVSDTKLAELSTGRELINAMIPRDLAAEIDELKTAVGKLDRSMINGV